MYDQFNEISKKMILHRVHTEAKQTVPPGPRSPTTVTLGPWVATMFLHMFKANNNDDGPRENPPSIKKPVSSTVTLA